MFPLGDDNSERQRWPVVTAVLVAVNVAVFLYELTVQAQGEPALQRFVYEWGVVPQDYATHSELVPHPGPYWITLLTSMFLHGGWGHLLGNMWYLWVFGDNVEDRMGRVFFLIFYLVAGVAGSLLQMAVDLDATIPSLGASGAISGVLGAYVVMFPRNPVRVLWFYFITEVPAWVILGLWIAMQVVSGAGMLSAHGSTGGGVAYMAHVGGFAAGVLGALAWRAIAGPPPARPPRVTRFRDL